jgi:hypothetical protein
LEELLARQLLAGLDDLGDAPVPDLEAPGLAALALEMKPELGPFTWICGLLRVVSP